MIVLWITLVNKSIKSILSQPNYFMDTQGWVGSIVG